MRVDARLHTTQFDMLYDDLYSTIGGKPLLGCFTRMFTVSAISNARGITNQVQFQLFFESRKGFGFPNSFRKTGPGTWTSNLKGTIAHLVLVLGTKTSDDLDDRMQLRPVAVS